MKQPEKRLVFYFYIKENWLDSITNRIHLNCLCQFSHIFDEVIFVVSVDDISNYDLIRSFELTILDIGFTPKISFKIVENTYLREAKIFYDLIATKLDEYDGLTFFGHNKGSTNLNVYELEQVSTWITALYYFSLSDMSEVVNSLTEGRELSYGPLLNFIKGEDINVTEEGVEPRKKFIEKSRVFLGEYKYFYMGTFFWINGRCIYDYIKKNHMEVPILNDRWYAENFCANLFPMEYAFSYRGRFSKNYIQEGSEIMAMINHCTTEEELEKYIEFKNNIMSLI